MSITSNQAADGHMTNIVIKGRFDFGLHREFRECYRNVTQPAHLFRVNLREAEYMDSSALGMLLLLNEHAQGLNGKVVIEIASPTIRKILEIAAFDKIFAVEG